MPIRISGMNSGLDTEALVSELVSAYNKKTDKYVKAQTKVSWKQEAWKTMSAKTYSFRKTLDKLRFSSAYKLKTTSVSNSAKATVTAGNNAVNGTQTLEISSLAKSGYLTGAQLKQDENGDKVTENTALSDLGFSGKGTVKLNDKEFTLSGKTTIKEAVAIFKDAGVDASFDATNQRIFISAKESGKENDFSLTAMDADGVGALKKLGLYVKSSTSTELYKAYNNYSGIAGNLTEVEKLLTDYNDNKAVVKDAEDAEAHLAKALKYAKAKQTVSKVDQVLGGWNSDKTKLAADLLQSGSGSKLVQADDTTQTYASYTYHKSDDGKEEYYTKDGDDSGKKYYLTTMTTTEDGKDVTKKYLSETKELNVTDTEALKQAIAVQTADDFLQSSGELTADDISVYREAPSTFAQIEAEAAAEDAAAPTGSFAEYRRLSKYMDTDDNWTQDDINAVIADIEAAQSTVASKKKDAQAAIDSNSVLDSYAKLYAAATNKSEVVSNLQKDIQFAAAMIKAEDEGKADYSKNAARIDGEDATIKLNGATFTSNTNSFSINGLTINAMALTDADEPLTITTATDNQGIYDKIKDFLSEYNSLINSMTSSYNAENTSSYEPLTSDEKDAMSESEIEKWEEKGKSGILRRDSTLSSLMSALTSVMSKSYTINGKNYALSSFGIKTLGIMNAEKNEHNAYHIDGDADDDSTSSNTDKLMAAIASDPDGVTQFFQKLSSEMYDKLGDHMSSTSLRSYGSFYNDKEMAKEYSDYTKTISDWEEKVADIEDSYYKKFAAMEKALAQLQSQTSQLSGLLGM